MEEDEYAKEEEKAQITPPKLGWMEFFSEAEFQDAVKESQKPIIKQPTKLSEIVAAESDSEPSCDNFEEYELAERFEAAVEEDDEIVRLP
jgi:hypothetical protein